MVTRMTEPQKQQEENTKHGTMIYKGNPSKLVQNMRLKLKEKQKRHLTNTAAYGK